MATVASIQTSDLNNLAFVDLQVSQILLSFGSTGLSAKEKKFEIGFKMEAIFDF